MIVAALLFAGLTALAGYLYGYFTGYEAGREAQRIEAASTTFGHENMP